MQVEQKHLYRKLMPVFVPVAILLIMILTGWPIGLISAQAAGGPFQVDGTDYDTLEEAAAAVRDGGTIILSRDAPLLERNGEVFLNVDKTYTFDLNGKTLTAYSYLYSRIVISEGHVTIKNGDFISQSDVSAVHVNNGKVVLDSLTVHTMGLRFQKAITVSGGSLSILSGTYIGGEDAVYCDGGQVVITSGHFIAEDDGFDNVEGPNGCLVTSGGGTISLALGSFADTPDWLNGAPEVTILSIAPSGITVKTQPKLTYTHGGTLDLSALEVTLIYNDGTSRDVAFADFEADNIKTSYINGASVKVEDNGIAIEISWSGLVAYTNPLQVGYGSGAKVPQTGDYNTTMLWMLLGGASLLGIGLIIVVGRRRYF